MAYTKQTWADLPSKTTPINAERLTHIEDGIFNAAQTADTAASTAGTAAANVGIVSGRVETLTGRVNDLDTAVSNKVDKVAGKGLSTNDYDDTDKGKVDSLGTASTKNSTSVVTESSDLVESGAVYDALAEKADNSVIGTVEGANASKAWSVGEHFIKDGAFKEVTQPIASGGAISDSNTVNKPIADVLDTVEDITSEFTFSTDCSWVTNWTKVKKIGRMITVVLRFTTPGTVSGDKSIITFPAKYKPIQLNDYSFSMAGLLSKAFSGGHAGLATFYISNNEYGIRLASTEWLANTAVVTQFTYMI